MTEHNQSIMSAMAHIVSTLAFGNYSFVGISYVYVSSSSHDITHVFRGIEIKHDRNQLEQYSQGSRKDLDTFAYYDNKCFLLQKEITF
jgi:hypothetical protein